MAKIWITLIKDSAAISVPRENRRTNNKTTIIYLS